MNPRGWFGDLVLIACGIWIGVGLHVIWLDTQRLIATIQQQDADDIGQQEPGADR